MPRAVPLALLAALTLAVAACTTAPSVPPTAAASPRDEPFAIDGRLSARRGGEGISIEFAWVHASPRDEFVVSTPLGQAVAELSGDASIRRVEVHTADGRREESSDWATLTERAVGFPLPVAGLAWWAQGAPRVGAPHSLETDAAGRAAVLRQDGCEIVYAYADGSTRRPSRLTLVCHDLELRIVIDRWRAA
jgi:outer membrane lipoprotein LolB